MHVCYACMVSRMLECMHLDRQSKKLGRRQSKKNCKGILFGCLSIIFILFYWRLPFAIGSMVVLMAQVAKSTISCLLLKEGALAPLYFGH